MKRLIAALLLALPLISRAADPQWVGILGHRANAADTDIARIGYRFALPDKDAWWMPTHVQLGASVWRVPDLAGTTRRPGPNATAVWRDGAPRGERGGG